MYEAYAVEEVVSKLSFDTTCIAPYNKQDKLFIGSKPGHLLCCARRTDGKRCFDYQLSRTFEKRSIFELKVVESHNLILCFSADMSLTVHSALEPFELLDTVNKYRPITAFAHYVCEDDNLLFLAICAKKRIFIFKWLVNSFEEDETLGLMYMPENIKTICWLGPNALIAAIRNDYFYINIRSDDDIEDAEKLRSLISTGTRLGDTPLLLEIPKKRWAALRCDNLVALVDVDGNYAGECRFSDAPTSIAYDSPYLLAVLGKDLIEVRTIYPSLLIQKIVLDGTAKLCAGNEGIIYVGSNRSLWLLNSKPLIRQNVKFLTDVKQYELAVILAKQHPEFVDASCLVETYRRRAFAFFEEKKFTECFNSHLEIKTDVLLVMNFFPFLIPEKYFDSMSKYSLLELSLFESKSCNFAENERKAAVLALGVYLAAKRTEYAQILSTHYKDFHSGQKENLLPTKILKKYEAILELVDTVLLKCYIMTKPSLISSLLRLPDNSCIISEAEKDLFSKGKFPELLILYERKRSHRKALDLLKRESKNKQSPLYGTDHLVEYLHNLLSVDMKLVFEYAPFVLKENVDAGIQIFNGLPDSQESVAPKVDHEEILEFLNKTCGDYNDSVLISYLEHVISRFHEQRLLFHDKLANLYITRVKQLMKNYIHSLSDDDFRTRGGEEEGELGVLRLKLMRFLESSHAYSAEDLLTQLDDYFLEEKAVLYGRLKEHDKTFSIYANILMDFNAAERHCALYYDSKDPVNSQIYLKLFKAYTSPMDLNESDFRPKFLQQSPQPNLAEALKILRKYPSRIDTVKAISEIPPDTKLSKVWDTLEAAFEAIKNRTNSTNMLLSIDRLAAKRYEDKLQDICSEKVVIDHKVECEICKKKIANSAFVRLQNGSINHFFCFKNLSGEKGKNDVKS